MPWSDLAASRDFEPSRFPNFRTALGLSGQLQPWVRGSMPIRQAQVPHRKRRRTGAGTNSWQQLSLAPVWPAEMAAVRRQFGKPRLL